VPANRWGSNVYSPVQLKMLQEIITLTAFCVFAFLYFDEKSDGIISPRCLHSGRGGVHFSAQQ